MRIKACPHLWFGSLTLLLSLFLATSSISAQTAVPVESVDPTAATPPVTELTLMAIPPRLGDDFTLKAKPGEKIQTVIRVRNNSDQTMAISTSAEDFIVDQDGKTPVPVNQEVSTRWSLRDWMTVSPSNQTIKPGENANVNIIIDVPSDALPGGHYAMVVHQPTPAGMPAGASQTSIGQRVGTLVYFVVDGPINEEAFVHNLTFPQLTEYGPVPFSLTIDNVSDVHIKPQVSIEIFNIFGQKVESINLETANIFPLIPRQLSGSWDRVWGIGLYKARAVMSYGSQGQIATAQTQFWLLPIKIVIAISVGVVAVLAILFALYRHIKHRRTMQRQKMEALERKIAALEKDKGL